MKRALPFIFMIFVVFALSLCAYAQVTVVDAQSAEDITASINGASDGDTVKVRLTANIEYGEGIVIDKPVTVEITFNGYRISYTGTKGKDSSVGAFILKNPKATLNLYGSNPVAHALSYTHYDANKRTDLEGSGNLICVDNGTVNINDAYLYATGDTFVIRVSHLSGTDAVVTVKSSVLRTKQGSGVSAIAYCGGNNSYNPLKKRLYLYNTVEYGGFKGTSYAFNVTRGSEFVNVKFYDFAIVNDSWISLSELYAHSYADALLFKNCIFKSYEEALGSVSVKTETGKHNIKLVGCQFTEIVNGGKFSGDSAGSADVFIVEALPTCDEVGSAYSYTSPKGSVNTKPMAEYKKSSFILAKTGHDESGKERVNYENGFTKSGYGVKYCAWCGRDYLLGTSYAPIFDDLGYSLNQAGNSVSRGISVHNEAYDEYVSRIGKKIELGVFVGREGALLTVENGALVAENGAFYPVTVGVASFFDIKISGFSELTLDSLFVAEFYAFDGETVSFIKESFGEVEPVSLNQLTVMLDEVNMAANALLESKHKLYYNEDGSFKVITFADMHVSPGSNTAEVEKRIKMLVDREQPDLVVFTGDNIVGAGSAEAVRTCIDKLVGYIEEKQIPWCHVYGNHDREGGMSNFAQQEIYESYEYCISKDEGGDDVTGVGNYVHGIFKKDGSLGAVIYFLDSGTSDRTYSYDYIEEDQIEWYKSTSKILKSYAGAELEGIMAFHIPLIENQYAYDNRNDQSIVSQQSGLRNEAICPSTYDTTLFETILECGDVKAIVTGHDHSNDYMYNYYGVKLCASPSFSSLGYSKGETQEGARVFELRANGDIETYVSYIIERVNPDDFGEYGGDTVIEDFEDSQLTVKTGGLDNAGLSGTFTVSVVDGKLSLGRSAGGNAEADIMFDKSGYGKLGDNKYFVVWADFTSVDFRKACFGLLSSNGSVPYRTDDYDQKSPFYYRKDGDEEWIEMSHGADGCFGTDQGSAVKGKCGYFAFPIEYFRQSKSMSMTSDTLVTGIYFYCDVNSGHGELFYFDNVMLVEDYKTLE